MTRCVAVKVVADCAPLYRVTDPDTLDLLTEDLASGQARFFAQALDHITCRGCQSSACAGCDGVVRQDPQAG